MIFLLLAVLALSLALLAREKLDSRREDALWEARRKRLSRLNYIPSVASLLNPDAFEWAPGAMWIVDDPRDVQVLSPAG